jgi:hypothetical protein
MGMLPIVYFVLVYLVFGVGVAFWLLEMIFSLESNIYHYIGIAVLWPLVLLTILCLSVYAVIRELIDLVREATK